MGSDYRTKYPVLQAQHIFIGASLNPFAFAPLAISVAKSQEMSDLITI